MKPKWFYEYIGMIAKTDVPTARRAFEAELLDEVDLHIQVKNKYDRFSEWDLQESITVLSGREATAVVTDKRPIPLEKRFLPQKFMIRPESIIFWAVDMKPDSGQFRSVTMFESMYIDPPFPTYNRRSTYSGRETVMEYAHAGHWEPHNRWYLIYPNLLRVDHGVKSNERSIY